MGFKLAEGHIDLKVGTTAFKKSMGLVKKTLVSVGRRIRAITRVVKLMFLAAIAAVGAMMYKFNKLASSAEETQAKFDTVFKEIAEDANKWAKAFGDAVGRANQDVKEWMARLQDTFVPLGFARDKAFGLSKALVSLAVDVASFNNKADADVIRDFTSALVGNHETVRKFGIIISETSIKQEAFNQGMDKTYKELTDLEKVQLRYSLIMKGSADAQGDAIRTADSYANQIKRLKSNLKDLGENIGKVFISHFTASVTALNQWIDTNEDKIVEWAEKVHATMMLVKDAMWDLITFMKTDWRRGFGTVLDIVVTEFKVFGNALYETVKWAFDKIADNVGVWAKRALARRSEYKKAFKRGMEEQQTPEAITARWRKFSRTGNPADLEADEKYARTKAENWIGLLKNEGFFSDEIPDRISTTFREVQQKIWSQAVRENKALWERMPEELREEMSKSMEKYREVMAGITEKHEKARDRMTYNAAGGGLGGVGGVGGQAKAAEAKLGFTGIREAWSRLATSIQYKDVEKQQLAEQKKTNTELKTSTKVQKEIKANLERLPASLATAINVSGGSGMLP